MPSRINSGIDTAAAAAAAAAHAENRSETPPAPQPAENKAKRGFLPKRPLGSSKRSEAARHKKMAEAYKAQVKGQEEMLAGLLSAMDEIQNQFSAFSKVDRDDPSFQSQHDNIDENIKKLKEQIHGLPDDGAPMYDLGQARKKQTLEFQKMMYLNELTQMQNTLISKQITIMTNMAKDIGKNIDTLGQM